MDTKQQVACEKVSVGAVAIFSRQLVYGVNTGHWAIDREQVMIVYNKHSRWFMLQLLLAVDSVKIDWATVVQL